MSETSGTDGWRGAESSAATPARASPAEPDVRFDASAAARAAFVTLSGVLLAQATGVVAGAASLVGAAVCSDADGLFVVQLVGTLASSALGVAVLAAAVRYAGAAPRRQHDAGRSVGVLALVAVVIVVIVFEPASYALQMGSTVLAARQLPIESFADLTRRTSYLALGAGALRLVANVAILGWAWLRWSRASRSA